MNSITVPNTTSIQLTKTGIIIERTPSLDEWLDTFSALWHAQDALRWCLGDMILYAETRADWGEMYAQALEETPFAYHTLTAYVRVCKAFPMERRRPGVFWTHYQHLASLSVEQQERMLNQIESGEIATTDETIARVQQEPIVEDGPPCPCCGETLHLSRSRCAACSATVYEMAYKYRDLHRAVLALYESGDRAQLDLCMQYKSLHK